MHLYKTVNDNIVPSVTTILDVLGNKNIIKWANILGFKHIVYEEELNRRANIGTKIHEILQCIVDPKFHDNSIKFTSDSEKDFYIKTVERFTNIIKQVNYTTVLTETSFASDNLCYGGTIDWLANINGILILNDFKSSRQVQDKHLLQLGGYYNLLKEANYDIQGANIIIVNRYNCKFNPISLNDLIELGNTFNDIARVYFDLEKTYKPDSTLYNKIFNITS